MNLPQRVAIDHHLRDLVEAFRSILGDFLDELKYARLVNDTELEICNQRGTTANKIMWVFALLQQKDNGWSFTINYLQRKGQARMAAQLLETAGE